MLAILQYLTYLLVGAFFLFFMSSFFSIAASFSIFVLVLIYLPLVLAGYFSGLSFFYPKISAILSIVFVLPFFILGIHDFFSQPFGYDPKIIIIPSSLVIVVSLFALIKSGDSFWQSLEKTYGKVLIGIVAGIPFLLATLMLVNSIIRIGSRIVRN